MYSLNEQRSEQESTRLSVALTDAKMVSLCVVAYFALFALATAASPKLEQCPGHSFPDLSENVAISCKGNPCKLKKEHNVMITMKFTPDEDAKEVKTNVVADVFGVPLPFIGVDGTSVCEKLETESGEKASCPLKAGTKYVYKDSFPILAIYPTISVKVHWALRAGDKDLACFEVPAKIVS